MNYKNLLVAFSIFLLLSCKNKFKEKVNITDPQININVSKDSVIKKNTKVISKSKMTFVFSDNSIKQELFIFNDNIKEEINFKLIYSDLNNEKIEMKGTAKIIKETIGEETISNYESNGYFVNEYKFNYNNSDIIFRIDSEEFKVARVLERSMSNQNKYNFSDNTMFNIMK